MPDELPTSEAEAAESVPATPAEPVAPEVTPDAPPAQAEVESPAATPTPDEAAYWQWLQGRDPDELLARHQRLAGKIGEKADKLAQKRVAEQRAQDEARRQEEERRRLRDEDPYKYAETEREREAEQAKANAFLSEVDQMLYSLHGELPPDIQQTLGGKQYSGNSPWESRTAYLRDVLGQLGQTREAALSDLKASHAQEKADWEKETARRVKEAREAGYKEGLGKANGSEPVPDLSGGDTSGGALSDAEWQSHKQDRTWIRENKARINEAVAAGRLRP